MSSTRKKGKKSKGTVFTLHNFLAKNGTQLPSGTTQVAKKIRNLDGDDSDDTNVLPLVYQLPTAPRANRISNDESIPHSPPFVAYITNLLFDVNENDVHEYFEGYNVKSVRLPRDDEGSGRSRGFGYVEFETREDLISVLSLPDPSIKGRRIRIDYTDNEQNGNRHKGGRRGYENSGRDRDRDRDRDTDMTNWRRSGPPQSSYESSRYDKGYGRSNWSNSGRDRDRDNGSGNGNGPGPNNNADSWRVNRAARSEQQDRDRDRDRDGGGVSFGRRREASEQERPKLNLKPRTLPLPERELPVSGMDNGGAAAQPVAAAAASSSSNVFGAAKPVDTTARDLEIENKLAETRKLSQDQELSASMKGMRLEDEGSDKRTTAITTNPASSWRRPAARSTASAESAANTSDEKSEE